MSLGRLYMKNCLSSLFKNFSCSAKSPHLRLVGTLQSLKRNINFTSSLPRTDSNLIRSRSIGIMVPNLTNAFFSNVIRGIENVTIKAGYSLYVCQIHPDPYKKTKLTDNLHHGKTAGIIVLSNPATKIREIKEEWSSIRVVSIQSDIKGVDNVRVTDEQGMFEATEHLLNLGHTRIAYISHDINIGTIHDRLKGFRAAHKKYNLQVDDNLIFEEHITSSGYITAKTLLQSNNPPTAIQCVNDHLAMGVYMAASELSVKIPQQLSVSGFDNTMMSRLSIPTLTTVAQPSVEMGETAARLIIKRIIGDERSEPKTIVLPTTHIIRESTAKTCR